MDVHKALADLTRHVIFKDWHKENQDYFLAHAFVMLDEPNKNTWQIGFYNTNDQQMVTFILDGQSVKKTEGQEVLKSEGDIKPLKPEHIKLSVEDALAKATQCYQEHYKGEPHIKHFFIIQNIDGQHLFNITYFTQAFNTINIKIDAETGDIIKHTKQKLAAFA